MSAPADVVITMHTTAGMAFEITDQTTGDRLAFESGWPDPDDDDDADETEAQAWNEMRRMCANRGWTIAVEAWS